MEGILIFDDNCGPCTAFAGSGQRRGRVLALGYTTPDAQKLMEAQFGKDYGFTLMFFARDTVYWGPEAAREAVQRAYASWLQQIMYRAYPFIVRALNFVLRRERLPEPPKIEGEELRQGGSVPITEEAYQKLVPLLEQPEQKKEQQ